MTSLEIDKNVKLEKHIYEKKKLEYVLSNN